VSSHIKLGKKPGVVVYTYNPSRRIMLRKEDREFQVSLGLHCKILSQNTNKIRQGD
jgi:hypothetical protein